MTYYNTILDILCSNFRRTHVPCKYVFSDTLSCACTKYMNLITSQAESQTTHTLSNILGNIESITGIIISIVTGVSIILGLRFLKSIKEKQLSATFSFWSQINVRIIRLRKILEWNKGVLNNMYSAEVRTAWETAGPPTELTSEFKALAVETINYIKETPDQMPAYIGWSNDFSEFEEFLSDVIQYDICDSEKNFISSANTKAPDRDKYCKKICDVMKRLNNGIGKKQHELETAICKKHKFQKCKGIKQSDQNNNRLPKP